MLTPQEIPGFYYDPEKKKYFRILPDHAAPTTSFYSTSSVEKIQTENTKNAERQKVVNRRSQQQQLSPFKSNPYMRATLFRQIGMGGSRENYFEDLRHIYTRGIRRRTVVELQPTMDISAMASLCNVKEKSVILGTMSGDIRHVPFCETADGQIKTMNSGAYSLFRSISQATSISVSRQGFVLATFMGEGSPPTLIIAHMSNPDLPLAPDRDFLIQYSLENKNQIRSLWTSTASSTIMGHFLLGTSAGGSFLQIHGHSITNQIYPTRSDVFAVEFIPPEQFLFLSGSRDGDMRLFDIRTRPSLRPAISVRHGTPITHIRTLTEKTVILNGLHCCAMYDLRFPHPTSPSSNFAYPTRATKTYDAISRKTEFLIARGFDVNKELGIIAAADHEHRVNLFSIATGEMLPSEIGQENLGQPCKKLLFDTAFMPEKLWAVEGSRVHCLSF